MDSDDNSEDFSISDGELDDKVHKKLVNNVLNLSYKQHVKKSTRSEPTLKVSEFDLVKTGKNVHITDLASVLERKGKQLAIGKQIKRAEQKLTTLPKPLEKPQAERIHRTVAYKKTQNELGKWDPIVSAIRSSTHTTFPLHSDSKLDDKVDSLGGADWGYKTSLQKELEKVEPKEEVYVMDDDDEFPMTMEEIMEKRREAAKMRAHESYKIAKARRQNKIKSKKFHRVQKKEKMKQQMKEFELLQKTNPEAALEKLEEIERARAEERMSLRHKSTGQWAKSKLIRAKYDRETRQELAQQLGISRDLTQKVRKSGDSDSETEAAQEAPKIKGNSYSDNPWLNENIKVSQDVNDFVSGYRKYWEEKNGINDADNSIDSTAAETQENRGKKRVAKEIDTNSDQKSSLNNNNHVKQSKVKTNGKVKRIVSTGASEWDVSDAKDTKPLDLDKEFDNIENKLRKKVEKKYKSLGNQKQTQNGVTKTKQVKKSEKPTQLDLLSLPKQITRPVIDEALDERAHRGNKTQDDMLKAFEVLNKVNNGDTSAKSKSKPTQSEEIDPNKFMNMKPTKLNTAIPDLQEFNDNEEGEDQRGVISEAFQDDDVVDEFQQEKKDEINAGNPKSIDLSLPGWGSWGGKDIKVSNRKKKRFIVRFPEKMKRKDSNKGHLIINENTNTKLRSHLVSEVPFPFKNVKDYEACIRAPIGNTFMPETAFRRLTKPAVTTKMGTVIEPMTEDILVKRKK